MKTTNRADAIKVRVEESTKAKLRAEAQIEGVDLSDIVRKAINLYFARRSAAASA